MLLAPAARMVDAGAFAARVLALAYVPALLVVAAVRAVSGADLAHAWAASPERLSEGGWWTLVASGLVVDRVQGLQLAAMAVLIWRALRRFGPRAFWTAMLGGHVGSTLVAFAGIGLLWDRGAAAGPSWTRPDFGVSCVWLALLSLLAADAVLGRVLRRPAAWTAVALAVAAGTGVLLAAATHVASVEHDLAVVTGVATALWLARPRTD